MPLQLDTPATADPVTVAEAKAHLRVGFSEDDTLIEGLIASATAEAQTITRRQLVTATWKLLLRDFPAGDEPIRVPLPPLQSVSSVKYFDTNGTEQTIASANYIVDIASEPGRIALAPDKTWPGVQDRINAVTVEFIAGYGDPSAVPERIKTAIKQLVGHWYENREAATLGIEAKEVPLAFERLLWSERVLEFA